MHFFPVIVSMIGKIGQSEHLIPEFIEHMITKSAEQLNLEVKHHTICAQEEFKY